MVLLLLGLLSVTLLESSPYLPILTAEAWGSREGIKAAISLGITHLFVEGDNIVVVNSLRKVWLIPWEINSFIFDAVMDHRVLDYFSINHCFRKAKQAAHFQAHKGYSIRTPHRYFELHDLVFLSIFQNDALGWSYIRD